jgi:hypothetical protein
MISTATYTACFINIFEVIFIAVIIAFYQVIDYITDWHMYNM